MNSEHIFHPILSLHPILILEFLCSLLLMFFQHREPCNMKINLRDLITWLCGKINTQKPVVMVWDGGWWASVVGCAVFCCGEVKFVHLVNYVRESLVLREENLLTLWIILWTTEHRWGIKVNKITLDTLSAAKMRILEDFHWYLQNSRIHHQQHSSVAVSCCTYQFSMFDFLVFSVSMPIVALSNFM